MNILTNQIHHRSPDMDTFCYKQFFDQSDVKMFFNKLNNISVIGIQIVTKRDKVAVLNHSKDEVETIVSTCSFISL